MKKLLLTVVGAAAISGMTTAQTPYAIPNAGFETWSTGKATSWSGYGDIGALYGLPYSMAATYFQDATNKNSGSYSIRLQNQNGGVGDLPGIAWLGTAGTSTANVGIYGIPFSQNINSFGGFFRYAITAPGSKDTAVVICQTTKWTGSTTQLIEDASLIIASNTTGFQNQTVPATNVNAGVPDTLWIVAFSSYWPSNDSMPNASDGYTSDFNMDDLTLTVVTGITAPVLDFVDTRVAPNPASDMVRFTTSAKNIGGYFRLFDALGKEVLSVQVTNALDNRFNVSALPAGVYFYQVSNTAGEVNAHGKILVTK
ncbi:MAG: hypothetical protein Fur0023_17450 [Bacteroidia bacterium]